MNERVGMHILGYPFSKLKGWLGITQADVPSKNVTESNYGNSHEYPIPICLPTEGLCTQCPTWFCFLERCPHVLATQLVAPDPKGCSWGWVHEPDFPAEIESEIYRAFHEWRLLRGQPGRRALSLRHLRFHPRGRASCSSRLGQPSAMLSLL